MKSLICSRNFRNALFATPMGIVLVLIAPESARAYQNNYCGCLAHEEGPCPCSKDFGISPMATDTFRAICDINDDGKIDDYSSKYTVDGSLLNRDGNTTCTGWQWMHDSVFGKDQLGRWKQCTNWSWSKRDYVTLKVTCGRN